ncbi:MAG: hypothetical protein ABSB78_14165 [Bacteroidota bacterium]
MKTNISYYRFAAFLLIGSIILGVIAVVQKSRQDKGTDVALQEIQATEQYLRNNTSNYESYLSGVTDAAKSRGYKIAEDGSFIRIVSVFDYLWFGLSSIFLVAAISFAIIGVIKRSKPQQQDNLPEQSQLSIKAKRGISISLIITVAALIVVVFAVVGGWYYFYGPCGTVRVDNASNELGDLISRWLAADNVASSTPRIALSLQINNLQSLRDEAGDLVVPSCMDGTKLELLAGMDSAIQGYIAFLGQQSDTVVSGYFYSAKRHIANFNELLLKTKDCSPFCK